MVGPALCRAVRKSGDGALDADAMIFDGAKSAEHDDKPWEMVFGRGMSDGMGYISHSNGYPINQSIIQIRI